MQILTLSLQAIKAIANLLFEPHPAEEQFREARALGEQVKMMAWKHE